MSKLTLSTLTTLSSGSAITALNNNFAAIVTAMENTLSRDGTSPNYMDEDLDMNSSRIVNLIAATTDTEPVRLAEFQTGMDNLEATVQGIASTTQGYLNSVISLYDSFDDRYLGPFSSDPSTDNDGNTLTTGAIYWNTSTNIMKVWTGTAWTGVISSTSGFLLDDLGDVTISSVATGDTLRYNGSQFVNYASSNFLDRTNHTGTQLSTTISDFTEAAQDAIGAMVNSTLVYADSTPALGRAAITGHISIPAGSNNSSLSSFTLAELNTAVSDDNIMPISGGTFTGKVTTLASASGGAGLNIPAGVVPTSPVIGDIWMLSSNGKLQYRTTTPSTQTLVTEGGTATLTTKTIDLTNNTLTMTLAQLNGAVSDADLYSTTQTDSAITSGIASAVGVSVQAYDATLAALAGITTATDKLIYATGVDTFSTTDFTSFGRSLVDDANASAARTTLGLVIGTDVASQTTADAKQAGIQFKDEGSNVGTSGAITSIDFVGTGVAASAIGNALTVTISGGGGGGLSDGDYGDITVSGGAAVMTIDNDVVTYAKMQNVGANSVPARAAATSGDLSEVALSASNLLGRGSTGDVAAISLGASLSMSGTTLSGTTASDTQAGVVELATTSETTTGTDTSRAVTPAGVAAAITSHTRLIGIGTVTSTGNTDFTSIGGPYTKILVIFQGVGTTASARNLTVALSEDNGGTWGAARNVGQLGTVSGNFTMGAATISDTANTATNKTIAPQSVGMQDIDATVAQSNYTTTATETVKTGVIDALRFTASGGTCTFVIQVFGVE